MKDLPTEFVEYRERQGSDQEEPAGGDHRAKQWSISEKVFDLGDARDWIPVEVALRICGTFAPGDLSRDEPADQRHGDEEETTPPVGMATIEIVIGVEVGEHRSGHHNPQDGRDIGGHVDDAVGACQILLRNHLWQDSVLRRAEEGALSPHQEEYRQHRDDRQVGVNPLQGEGGHPQCHGEDLHRLGDDDDLTLGEAVRDRPPEYRKEHEGEGEDRHHSGLRIDRQPLDGDPGGNQQYELAKDIVVEGAEQLGTC